MKKLLSVLLILAMLATSLLSFASCGGGKINEKKAQENPNEALQNALEANKIGFFADPTGAKAVIDKALNTEGSVGIAFESDTLLMEGMIKKIELSLVGEGADMHLVTAPVKEIEGLAAETLTFSSLMPEEEISLTRDAYDITLECEVALTLSVFGKELVLQKGSARIIADICSVELWNNEFYTVIGHVMKNEEIKHVSGAKASNIKISKLSDIHK